MPDLVPIRRALLSVSDKSGLVDLAETLRRHGVEIVSTGGTARALAGAGIDIVRVEDVTGMPEMMGGRVKTLHPAILGAVLARRDVADDRAALEEHGLQPIDLVCVNLYPFEEEKAIEQIDIGGPTLLRSAAKNPEFVTVLTSPRQYDALAEEIERHGGATTLAFRKRLAGEAFSRTAGYDRAITAWLDGVTPPAETCTLTLTLTGGRELRYGENPHQTAAVWIDPAYRGPSVAAAELLRGKPLSYNNVQDAAAALELVQDLAALRPDCAAATVIKHTNACGAAVAGDIATALERACEGDPRAAYGGIVAGSRPIDRAAAQCLAGGEKFLEVVVAPRFEDEAIAVLGERWKNVRLLAVGHVTPRAGDERTWRSIPGGMLVQTRDAAIADPRNWTHAAGPVATPTMLEDAAFSWTVAKHLKSNAVALAFGNRLLGAGCGQADRVTACRLAVEKARELGRLSGEPAAAASDAFFPFADGPSLLIDAGVRCIVHPGGSRRDRETLDLCTERGVTCLLTGVRHFRH